MAQPSIICFTDEKTEAGGDLVTYTQGLWTQTARTKHQICKK